MEGSSPRMRGTHRIPAQIRIVLGIIPAYAGNTHAVSFTLCQMRDHPRVCGEHRRTTSPFFAFTGSSPRMRGTRFVQSAAQNAPGIIPAYAGNTYNPYRCGTGDRDHPRVCGEHIAGMRAMPASSGSSPRMRGTLRPQGRDAAGPGIIPAYAGNTSSTAMACRRNGDHPRVCGEHTKRL